LCHRPVARPKGLDHGPAPLAAFRLPQREACSACGRCATGAANFLNRSQDRIKLGRVAIWGGHESTGSDNPGRFEARTRSQESLSPPFDPAGVAILAALDLGGGSPMSSLNRLSPRALFAVLSLGLAGCLLAQEASPPPNPTPTPAPAPQASSEEPEKPEPTPTPKAPEGAVIINLPSVDVPRPGTLTLLFTHRFSEAVADSDIHSLFSFDSGADIGIGLAYAPVRNLDVSFYRSSAI